MIVDVVKEPSWTLVLRIWVSPYVESELNLTCIRNVGNRRHRDVAVYPPAVSRGSENRNCSCWSSFWTGRTGGHRTRISSIGSNVTPVSPAIGIDSILYPSPISAACCCAIEMIPVIEGHVVIVDGGSRGDV